MSKHQTDRLVIWCSYFDQDLSSSSGRKMSKKLSVKSPNISMLVQAAKDLKLDYIA